MSSNVALYSKTCGRITYAKSECYDGSLCVTVNPDRVRFNQTKWRGYLNVIPICKFCNDEVHPKAIVVDAPVAYAIKVFNSAGFITVNSCSGTCTIETWSMI